MSNKRKWWQEAIIYQIYPKSFMDSNIEELVISPRCVYYGEEAFKNCVSLEKINIPPKVKYLTSKMFYGCVSLREIIVENLIPLRFYPEKMCCMDDAESLDDDKFLYFCVRIKCFKAF